MSNFADLIQSAQEAPVAKRAGSWRMMPADFMVAFRERAAELEGIIDVTPEHAAICKRVVCDGINVFLTGDAGTGKSTLIRDLLVPLLDSRSVNFQVVASTGIAASHHPGGRTLHSWAGIGLGPKWPEDVNIRELSPERIQSIYQLTFDKWKTTVKAASRNGIERRIKGCELLIVDEISMCPGLGLLDYIDFFFQQIRGNDKPFGGLQILFVGDFCQLPPVDKTNGVTPDWAFFAKSWSAGQVHAMKLTRVFRQVDPVFTSLLGKVRAGSMAFSPEEMAALKSCRQDLTESQRMRKTNLVATNAEADNINRRALDFFEGEAVAIDAVFEIERFHLRQYETIEKLRETLAKITTSKTRLVLKKGLPVLITVNDAEGRFVNGTKAYVSNLYRGEDGTVNLVGLTIPHPDPEHDDIEITLKRRRTARSLHDDEDEFVMHSDGEGAPPRQVRKHPTMCQFPIIPATAITVHKSQGMSLDECVIALDRTFAPGHVYVAVSRLRSLAGLTLTSSRFDPQTDPLAARYHAQIQTEELPLDTRFDNHTPHPN